MVRMSQSCEGNEFGAKEDKTLQVESDGNVRGDGMGNKNSQRQFKELENDSVISDFSAKESAQNSNNKIKWAVNLYGQWCSNRWKQFCNEVEILRCDLDKLNQFSKGDMCFALSQFIREIKKLNGEEYPPNALREIVIMIQMYLHKNNVFWKLLDHDEFLNLCNVSDNTMKQRHATGLGVRKSSEVIMLDHETQMFNQGILGDSNPLQLLNTMVYMVGMHCALRGGLEHNKLRRPGFNSHFSFEFDKCGVERLVYHEDPLQKINQGGLVCKGSSKVVFVYGSSDKMRCPLCLFKKYVSLLLNSKSCKKFYLCPKKKVTPRVWYCDQPSGINTIKKTIKEMCKSAGFEGKFTNHSQRAMCATCMYENDVPEQKIKEVTGHKSECVRAYKRTSDKLRENVSHTLSMSEGSSESKGQVGESSDCKKVKIEKKDETKDGTLSVEQMIANVNKTKLEIRRKQFLKARSRLSLSRF